MAGINPRSIDPENVFGVVPLKTQVRIDDPSAAATRTFKQTMPFRANVPKMLVDYHAADPNLKNVSFEVHDHAGDEVPIRRRARSGVKQKSFIKVTGSPAAEDGVAITINGHKPTGYTVQVYTCVIEIDDGGGANILDTETITVACTTIVVPAVTCTATGNSTAALFQGDVVTDLNADAAFVAAGFIAQLSSRTVANKAYVIISGIGDFGITVVDNTSGTVAEVAPQTYDIAQSIGLQLNVQASPAADLTASSDADSDVDSAGSPATLPFVGIEWDTAAVPFKVEATKDGTATFEVEEQYLFPFQAAVAAGDNVYCSLGDDDDFQVAEFDQVDVIVTDEQGVSSLVVEAELTFLCSARTTASNRPENKKATTLYTERDQV